jgi:hypothetical protein
VDLLFLTRFKEGRLRVDREDDELPQVGRRSRTVKRVIYELFFHAKRPVPARISVTGHSRSPRSRKTLQEYPSALWYPGYPLVA